MSYQYPPPNQPPYGAPAYGQPPQGYQQPPYPQQQYGAPPGPPQGHYPPPQGHYGQPPLQPQGYHGAPSPQPPVGYGAPPPGGFNTPSPQPPYGGPPAGPPPAGYHAPSPHPPGGYGAPPQQGYNQPPPFAQGPGPGPQGYGAPPGQPPVSGGPGLASPPLGAPGPNQFGAPPQGAPGPNSFGAPPPGAPGPNSFGPPMPSLGYTPGQKAPGDFRREADILRKAMKGFGTDETAMIQVLGRLDPLQMAAVRATYSQHLGRDLYKDVKGETSGYLKQAMLSVIDGPLGHDVEFAHESIDGMGTKEWLMNEVLLGRSNADMNAIKTGYERKYHRQLHMDIADDLSFKTASLFKHVISARRHEESAPLNPETMQSWVVTIREKRDMDKVCEIFGRASNNELRAMDHECHAKYRTSLLGIILDRYTGHMQEALWYMVQGATDPAMRDAIMVEKAMEGAGTKDERLVVRIVRLHWNRDHKEQVKRAYRHKYKKDLIERVRGETSGDYQNFLVALLQ